MPLYERGKAVKSPAAAATDKPCAQHPHTRALDACPRCGGFRCELCRARWRGQVLCVTCVNRALEANEPPPPPGRAPLVATILALVLSVLGWAVIGVCFLVAGLGAVTAGMDDLVPSAVLGLLLLASPVVALLGVVLGMAALRVRGRHLIPAAIAVGLGSAQVGAALGVVGFAVVEVRQHLAAPEHLTASAAGDTTWR
jgi:hypothetical protein